MHLKSIIHDRSIGVTDIIINYRDYNFNPFIDLLTWYIGSLTKCACVNLKCVSF